jgi:hypothetical protein
MAYKFIRVRISSDLYRRFKVHCLENEVSIPKQMTEFVRKFMEVQDENKKLMGK